MRAESALAEYEAALNYVLRLERKRDSDDDKIPLSDRERQMWERRIATAERILLSRWTVAFMAGHHDLPNPEEREK